MTTWNDPEMPITEWEKLQKIVEADIERQIDEHIEDRHEKNRVRARLGLEPL